MKSTVGSLKFLAIISLAGFVSLVSFPIDSKAQNDSSLLTQIEALKTQVVNLQNQLNYAHQSSSNFRFLIDLKEGDRHPDVIELQKILNSDTITRVSTSGPGSSGNETDFFGALTKSAVIRFQEKHIADILWPAGLNSGTGYVGTVTRAKLNNILEEKTGLNPAFDYNSDSGSFPPQFNLPEASTSQPSISNNQSLQTVFASGDLGSGTESILPDSQDLTLAYPSKYSGPIGTSVVLFGSGFNSSNTVYFGNSHFISNITSNDGSSLSFVIPNIPYGKYEVYVENEKGVTEEKTFFVVTDPLVAGPEITKVSPSSQNIGGEISISGSGFVPNGNMLLTGYGIIENISSPDGKTLNFSTSELSQLADIQEVLDFNQEEEWVIYFHVVNDKGVTENPGQFNLKI